MNVVDLIIKKRDGGSLSNEELTFLINGYAQGRIPDYQLSAWAMAVFLRGMDDRETADLTMAMARSGDQLGLQDIAPLTCDKHSTGGIGDKTSLVLGPLVAALDLPIAKMSGRGLGFTGGTLDKLEAIPGLRVDLSAEEFRRLVREVGLVIAGQSAELAPADKQLYALRDVTGTIESIPLIAASVMSKKLAAGADCVVLDVKAGRGAFMESIEAAQQLAQTMVRIGQLADRRVAAILSSMEQPLGYAIGNALEVREAIATLRGHGPADLRELCLALGAQLVLLAERAADEREARAQLEQALRDGRAWEKFRRMVAAQGGDVSTVDAPERLPAAPVVEPLAAEQDGYVTRIDARALGMASMELGGGRQQKGDAIDHSVGIVLERKVGDQVRAGETLLKLHARSRDSLARVRSRLAAAVCVSAEPPDPLPLVLDVVR